MPKKFLHLGIDFKEKPPTSEALIEVEAVLNSAKDWYRYAPNCWLIYTGRNASTWQKRLREIPWMASQRYLIVEINTSERAGWLARDTWDWIKKERPAS